MPAVGLERRSWTFDRRRTPTRRPEPDSPADDGTRRARRPGRAEGGEARAGRSTALATLRLAVRVIAGGSGVPEPAAPSPCPPSDPPVGDSATTNPRNDLVEHVVERGRRFEAKRALGFLGAGTRRCTSCSYGASDTQRSGTSSPLILRQIVSASSSTVVDCAVERLKSSLSAAGCSIAVAIPRARSRRRCSVPDLTAVAENAQGILALGNLLDGSGTTRLIAA
jgi:hypothetical protein